MIPNMGKNATAILADNLNRYIGAGKMFSSNEAAAARSHVGRSTIDRARKGEVSVRVDNLEQLAKAFGLSAWQLLHPDPDALRRDTDIPKGAPWPLPGITPDEFKLIPSDELSELVGLVQSKVQRHKSKGDALHNKSPGSKKTGT